MPLTSAQLSELPSPFYRVATRAVILDEQGRILVAQNHDDEYELPGGGWEYDESFQVCLNRELQEELGVSLKTVGEPFCMYRGRGTHGKMNLRIAAKAELDSHDFKPLDMKRVFWASRAEFMALDLSLAGEEGIKEYADKIWSEQ